MQSCLVCGKDTLVIVNIHFKAAPVCDHCCLSITKQTVATLTTANLLVPADEHETVDTVFGQVIVGGEG